ncbi:MAG: hypothetical protein LUG95_02975 [Clostridiales bacterium]|nr:hypothetical protein [Clostridiales bacterium]
MIAGDVSNDGELVSHIEFKQKLYKLKEKKKVYLITATHDWCCDGNPRRFSGGIVTNDVETVSSDKLCDFYYDFGPKDALSEYITHIGTYSYVVQLSDNVRLLALNDDKNENDHAGFSEEHFRWIEQQIKNARQDGCLIIGMEHHLLVPHISPLITGGSICVKNREYVASRLADAGLRYMFVGHSHIQNTADFISEKGNKITEVNVGSLVGYPAPIVNVTVNDDMTLTYDVDHLDTFTLDSKEVDAQKFLASHCTAIIHRLLDCATPEEFADRLTALQLDGKTLSKFFPIARPILNIIKNDTVGRLYKRLKHLGLGRSIDESLVKKFSSEKLLSFVDSVMLSAMDGSIKKIRPQLGLLQAGYFTRFDSEQNFKIK